MVAFQSSSSIFTVTHFACIPVSPHAQGIKWSTSHGKRTPNKDNDSNQCVPKAEKNLVPFENNLVFPLEPLKSLASSLTK